MGAVWSFLMCMSSSLGIHIILHLLAEFHPNRPIHDIVLTSYPFPKMAVTNSISGFVFCEFAHLGRSKYTCIPNFGEVGYLNPLPRYYYFRFLKTNVRHVESLLPVSILTFRSPSACQSAFAYQISSISDHPSVTELWRHIQYPRWRPHCRNSTSGFGFRELVRLRMSKSTCIPNFGEISHYTAEILLLSVPGNKRPPC